MRAKEWPLREIVDLYTPFPGLLHLLEPHTLLISPLNCLPDMKKKVSGQPHPYHHLLSLPHRELWTPVQLYIKSITILFNLFCNKKKYNGIGSVLIFLAFQYQHQWRMFWIKHSGLLERQGVHQLILSFRPTTFKQVDEETKVPRG